MYSPKFTITNKILKNIGSIEASKEVIDKAPLLPYYERQFQIDAIVRTVHFGTHIEGNELTINQAEKILQGKEISARERDVQEVLNYRRVMDYISDKADSKVSEDTIKEIHKLTVQKILPSDESGVYRKTQVVVKNSKTGQVSFRPPMAVSIPFQIRDLVFFISSKEDVHPVLKAGAVHYELVRIHPFVDGNGRVGRALSTLVLFQEGYDIRKFFSLEEYFDTNAERYYEALQSVGNDGDLTHFLEYFSLGLAIELSKIKDRIEKISIDANLRQKLGGKPVMLSDRQLKIIEYIQEVGYLQNKAFEQIFPMVSEDTILNELKGLSRIGLVKKQGITKSARYVMTR
ncbi:MAG TPA: Fic family protein [Patescibacteria group bacterium]|nr:Fic family protein [Patescibacteria group bacterium]